MNSGSVDDAAAARRWVAAVGESGFERSVATATGAWGATFTVTELAHAPTARAVARICVCIKRRRDAHPGEDAKKTRRSLRRLANLTCSRNGEGNVWRKARSSASSALALPASVAKEPQSARGLGPLPRRRVIAGVSRCMVPEIDLGKTCKSYSYRVPAKYRRLSTLLIGDCAGSFCRCCRWQFSV